MSVTFDAAAVVLLVMLGLNETLNVLERILTEIKIHLKMTQ